MYDVGLLVTTTEMILGSGVEVVVLVMVLSDVMTVVTVDFIALTVVIVVTGGFTPQALWQVFGMSGQSPLLAQV